MDKPANFKLNEILVYDVSGKDVGELVQISLYPALREWVKVQGGPRLKELILHHITRKDSELIDELEHTPFPPDLMPIAMSLLDCAKKCEFQVVISHDIEFYGKLSGYYISPTCSYCIHIDPVKRSCPAFPEGIPSPIWSGNNKHTSQYPGDQGIIFFPRSEHHFPENPEEVMNVIWTRFSWHIGNGLDFLSAGHLLIDTLPVIKNVFGDGSPELIKSLYWIGWTREKIDNLYGASEWYRRALNEITRSGGFKNDEVFSWFRRPEILNLLTERERELQGTHHDQRLHMSFKSAILEVKGEHEKASRLLKECDGLGGSSEQV